MILRLRVATRAAAGYATASAFVSGNLVAAIYISIFIRASSFNELFLDGQ
jgi:hypothetical protein